MDLNLIKFYRYSYNPWYCKCLIASLALICSKTHSRTTQRVIYGEALSSGKSVFNIESSGEAASEIQNITKELQNFIYEQKI